MLSDQWRFILFDPKPKSIAQALRSVQEGLAAGDAVGIFSEGGISRTGQILSFKRGLDWVLGRVEAPIVPVHIDGMWGSVLSFSEGRFFGKWPRRIGGGWRRPLTVWFGSPLPVGTSPREARFALQELTAHGVRDRMVATRNADREIAGWLRRYGGAAGPVRAALEAMQGHGGVVSDGRQAGRTLEWSTLAATAEAFDGSCLVRRDDRMVSSLGPGDPLSLHLGVCGGPLLGIAATAVDAGLPATELLEALGRSRATIWVARAGQVAAVAALPSPPHDSRLPDVIVIPIDAPADLEEARRAAEAFKTSHGIEPVVAFAPEAVGGLVAMNTPPSRLQIEQEVSCRPESLGRVVIGVVVWPEASHRARLGLAPAGDNGSPADSTLVVAATGNVHRDAGGADGPQAPPSFVLGPGYLVDDQGFLYPPGTSAAAISTGEAQRGRSGAESRHSKSNLG
jgi:hypothetical protein